VDIPPISIRVRDVYPPLAPGSSIIDSVRTREAERVEPATVEDTAEYVAFRLKSAGADHEIFSRESLTALHELASGSLREIDRLASAAMRESARQKRKLVDRDGVARVAETLTLSSALGGTAALGPRGSSASRAVSRQLHDGHRLAAPAVAGTMPIAPRGAGAA
jgi:hypothetical protein